MLKREREFVGDILRQADWVLLLLCLAATGYGIVMIASATNYLHTWRYVVVQAVAAAIGVALYFAVSLIDLPTLAQKGWKWLFLFNIGFILLLLTPFGVAGDTGNRAWLEFPFLPVKIQPAEVVKLTFIILFAYQLVWLKEKRGELKSIVSISFLVAHLGILFGLYYVISDDMGSGLVLVFIFVCMCFMAGVAWRWFFLGIIGAAAGFYILWNEDKIPLYMMDRFRILFDHSYDVKGVGWHQTRSLMTLGGGKLTGQGLFHGTQTQSEYSWSLPNRHTDFIFSVIGEELGAIGCVVALLLLAAIVLRCLWTAKNAKSMMEAYVCVGVAGMLIFQIMANVGMCLFVMPVIGLTLPFFSYGGSSILTLFMAMGMVSGVQKRSLPDWLK